MWKKIGIGAVVVLAAVYAAGVMAFAGRYPPRTEAGGAPVGLMTPAEASLSLSGRTAAMKMSFTSKDGRSETLPYGALGISRPSEAALAADVAPSSFKWPLYLFRPMSFDLDPGFWYDEAAMESGLSGLSAVRLGTTMPKDSEVVKLSDGTYAITAEVEGNAIDMRRLIAAVEAVAGSGGNSVDLAGMDCYMKPGMARTDGGLLALVGMASAPRDMKVSLDVGGGVSADLDKALISACFTVDGDQIAMDPEGLQAVVDWVSANYDTYGTTRRFETSTGTVIDVSPRTEEIGPCDFGGWMCDQDSLYDLLAEKLAAGEDCVIEVPWKYKGVSRGELNDFGDTYLEISIPDQHMWLYSGGSLLIDTDVVTGLDSDPERRTPPGIYRTTDFYTEWTMRGADYTAFCHYFVRLTLDGVGVHDASRSSFGGEVYRTNGSHGCINTPCAAVKIIFEFLYERQYGGSWIHTPVIVWGD